MAPIFLRVISHGEPSEIDASTIINDTPSLTYQMQRRLVSRRSEEDVRALSFIMEKIESLDQIEKSSIAELTISEKQKQFRNFIEDLKRKGITGAEYREKVAEWTRKHR